MPIPQPNFSRFSVEFDYMTEEVSQRKFNKAVIEALGETSKTLVEFSSMSTKATVKTMEVVTFLSKQVKIIYYLIVFLLVIVLFMLAVFSGLFSNYLGYLRGLWAQMSSGEKFAVIFTIPVGAIITWLSRSVFKRDK